MEAVQHSAKITLVAEIAGGQVLLSSCEVAKLMATRARYSVPPPPGEGGGLPVTSDSGETPENYVTLARHDLDVGRSGAQGPRARLGRLTLRGSGNKFPE